MELNALGIHWSVEEIRGSLEFALALGLFALAIVATLAQRTRIPYPIFLVLAGLGLGFVPGVSDQLALEPDLVFVIFLPPLIYAAAYFASLRELHDNVRSIGSLAVGLVLFTTLTVALVAHTVVDGMSWAVAFTLGAIVSPTDPVAGTAVLERLRVPRRVMHIVEGESLINDGSGLVLYKVAVAAVVSGTFSLVDAGGQFLINVIGGIAVGVAMAAAMTFVRRRNAHGPTDVLLSLLSGYLAYLPAEALHVSGVLAAATAGIWLGWRTPTIVRASETRLQIDAVWVNAVFVINTVLFLLVGVQMQAIVARIEGVSAATLVVAALAVSVTVMVTRLLWVYPNAWFVTKLPGGPAQVPNWRNVLLVGWIGMRGSVSLAAALALPLAVEGGGGFPQRDLVVFLTFSVILMTIVVQGLTLPWVIGRLDLDIDDSALRHDDALARVAAADAAIARIEALQHEAWVHDLGVERMRSLHDYRKRRFEARVHGHESLEQFDERAAAWQRMGREVHEAQRAALVALRDDGTISDEAMVIVQRDIDFEDMRLGL